MCKFQIFESSEPHFASTKIYSFTWERLEETSIHWREHDDNSGGQTNWTGKAWSNENEMEKLHVDN